MMRGLKFSLAWAKRSGQLQKGVREEREHAATIKWLRSHPEASVDEAAQRIALDHLRDDPTYYDKIAQVEVPARRSRTGLKSPRLKLLARRGRLRVYLVNATAVRKLTHLNPNAPDFTMGTGDQVWENVTGPWEVWVSDELGPFERKLTMLHEMTERRLMKRGGLTYDDAHEQALAVEDKYRQAGGRGLDAALRREKGQ